MSRIAEWCQRYVGTPYSELNCWELCRKIFATEFGINIGPVEEQRHAMQDRHWIDIQDGDIAPREGDVILFKDSPVNRHVAILLDDTYMIHSQKGMNCCIESWRSRAWKNRIVGIYRHRER